MSRVDYTNLHILACLLPPPFDASVDQTNGTSAPSSLNFGVKPLQFHAGVFDPELPVDPALFGVRFV
jgi:hypothetical protein